MTIRNHDPDGITVVDAHAAGNDITIKAPGGGNVLVLTDFSLTASLPSIMKVHFDAIAGNDLRYIGDFTASGVPLSQQNTRMVGPTAGVLELSASGAGVLNGYFRYRIEALGANTVRDSPTDGMLCIDSLFAGANEILKDPGAGQRLMIKSFMFTQSIGGTIELHFGNASGDDIRWSGGGGPDEPIGMSECAILGPTGGVTAGILKFSNRHVVSQNIIDGYVRYALVSEASQT